MSPSQSNRPKLLSVAPRFLVQDMERALAFYGQLGFQTTHNDGGFAIVERDGVSLHFNHVPDSPRSNGVCWIVVSDIDDLYQQYLPTNAVRSSLETTQWGTKGFFLQDPFCNLLLFAERLPEDEENKS